MNVKIVVKNKGIMSNFILDEPSAGICDTCNRCKVYITGDGVTTPIYKFAACEQLGIEIEPAPLEEQKKECNHYEHN